MYKYISFIFSDFMVAVLSLDSFVIKNILRDFIKENKPREVLDLGCGSGSLSPLFSKSIYTGIDIDKKLIEYAKLKHPDYNFVVGDVTSFNLNKKFDFIFIVGVLHHLNDMDVKKTLVCMRKCLKDSGKIVIIEAIPPIIKINIIGSFLRAIDKGKYIRYTEKYRKFISKQFYITNCYSKLAGFFDYGIITGRNK